MGKKVNGKTEAKAEAKAHGAKAEAKAKAKAPKYAVRAIPLLRHLNLDWVLERPLDESDLAILDAQVSVDNNGTEWASWWLPYKRADGTEVRGIAWGISAPLTGGILILRLYDSGVSKATIKAFGNGKGVLTGAEPVVRALLSRPDIRPWTDEDTAALL